MAKAQSTYERGGLRGFLQRNKRTCKPDASQIHVVAGKEFTKDVKQRSSPIINRATMRNPLALHPQRTGQPDRRLTQKHALDHGDSRDPGFHQLGSSSRLVIVRLSFGLRAGFPTFPVSQAGLCPHGTRHALTGIRLRGFPAPGHVPEEYEPQPLKLMGLFGGVLALVKGNDQI